MIKAEKFKEHFDEVIARVADLAAAERRTRQRWDLQNPLGKTLMLGTVTELQEMGVSAAELLRISGITPDFVLMSKVHEYPNGGSKKQRPIPRKERHALLEEYTLLSGWHLDSVPNGISRQKVAIAEGSLLVPIASYDQYYITPTRGLVRSTEYFPPVSYTNAQFPYGVELFPEFAPHAPPREARSIARIPELQERIVHILQKHQIL